MATTKTHPIVPCSTCGLPFQKNSGSHKVCMECRGATRRAQVERWKESHPERVAAYKERAAQVQRDNALEVNAYNRARHVAKPQHEGECPECGELFVGYKHRKFCTATCGRRYHTRNGLRIRRLRIKNTESETFGLFEIAERDGWVCWLCDAEVSREEWSVDHVIPIAAGGPHTRANVKLAHRSCNSRRSTAGYKRIPVAA